MLDVTWDAGSVGASGSYEAYYDTSYLFLEPELMIYSHFPEDPRWQLLNNQLTADECSSLPYFTGDFLSATGAPISGVGMYTAAAKELIFDVPHPEATRLLVRYEKLGAQEISGVLNPKRWSVLDPTV